MTRKWIRIVRARVSGKAGSAVFEGLKIDFDVTKTIGSKQNTATISLYNLSKSRRAQLGDEFDRIVLEAGYRDDSVGVIFAGSIRDVSNSLDGADIESEIEGGDGDEAIAKGAVSKTFPPGTKPRAIVEHLAGAMPGIGIGMLRGLDDLPAYRRPVSVWGYAFRELDQLGREHGFYWSIQDGQFQAVKHDMHLGGTVLIAKETGMVGAPEETDKGIKVKTLLDTAIRPGRLIDVRSEFLDAGSGRDKRPSDAGGGLYRVASVRFNGSNRDTEFYAEIEANRVQGDKVRK